MRLWPIFALLIAAWAYLIFKIPTADSHEWYSWTIDPVYLHSCCGSDDCGPVDAEWVSEEAGGYRLKMTIEQSMTVNPSSQRSVDAFIPRDRVQSPPKSDHHQFYACIYHRDRARPHEGVICFFATPTM